MIRRPPRSTLFPYTTPSDLKSRRSFRRRPSKRAKPSSGKAIRKPGCSFWSTVAPALTSAVSKCPRSSRSEEHTSELQSRQYLVCRLLLEKKKKTKLDSSEHC